MLHAAAFLFATPSVLTPHEELNAWALARHILSLCYYVSWAFLVGLSGSPPIYLPCLECFKTHPDPEFAVCHSRSGLIYPLYFHILQACFASRKDLPLCLSSIASLLNP